MTIDPFAAVEPVVIPDSVTKNSTPMNSFDNLISIFIAPEPGYLVIGAIIGMLMLYVIMGYG